MLNFVFLLQGKAQTYSVQDWRVHDRSKATEVHALHHDSLSSSFVLYLKSEVPSHRHLKHTEVVTVLKGKARMKLGTEVFVIKRGDIVVIPVGTFHSVVNMKNRHLVVLSVQSPEFDGSDREWESNTSPNDKQ